MNLISCESCGVVLDLTRIPMPEIADEGGSINEEVAAWTKNRIGQGRWESTIKCPVCSCRILYSNGRRA